MATRRKREADKKNEKPDEPKEKKERKEAKERKKPRSKMVRFCGVPARRSAMYRLLHLAWDIHIDPIHPDKVRRTTSEDAADTFSGRIYDKVVYQGRSPPTLNEVDHHSCLDRRILWVIVQKSYL